MKKLFTLSGLIAIILAGCQVASAQSSNIGGDLFIQHGAPVAVLSNPIKTLVHRGNLTASIDAMAGANLATTAPAIGGTLALHYNGGLISGVAGLGCAYDVASKFELADVNSKSVGFLIGIQIDVWALLNGVGSKKKAIPQALSEYHVIDSSKWH